MELTRRDALAALTVAGALGSGATVLEWDTLRNDPATDSSASDHEIETLDAVAMVVYPTDVTGIPEFIETYVVGRLRDRPDYAKGLTQSLRTLDEYAQSWFDAPYSELSRTEQDTLLRQMGIDVSEPIPDGSPAERLRYYVVNELLYALYTTPTGGKLAGIENPIGYPDGTISYQRGPR